MNNDTHRLLRIAMHLLDALNNSLPEVFRAIDLMGVLLNGILGGKVARERNFDAVGFCILAIMTALAGGMIRDLLLTERPSPSRTPTTWGSRSSALSSRWLSAWIRACGRCSS